MGACAHAAAEPGDEGSVELIANGSPALLLMALALDWLMAGFAWAFRIIPHPVVLIGQLIGWFDRRLNREERGERVRLVRGAIVVIVVVGLAALAGWGSHRLSLSVPYGWIVELVLITVLLAQRSLFDHVRRVGSALRKRGLAAGRDAVRHIVGRDVTRLDEHGVARAAIESCAENFSDAVVAPAFWYLLLGLPGIFAYKAVNTLDSMIGYLTPRHRAFGMVAARLDDAMNWIPARLAALILALAAIITPTANAARALVTVRRDARNHRSPNAGWPEAAMAGALGLSLAGPRPYHGEMIPAPWIGDGIARAQPTDIRRALYLYAVACLIVLALTAALALVLGG